MRDPRREGALSARLLAGRHGVSGDAPGVALAALHPGAMAQIVGARDPAALAAALRAFALDGEPHALRCTSGQGLRLLWNGPGQYLAVSWRHRDGELAAELDAALHGNGAAAVDVSHARTVLRLSGAARCEVLAQGCPLDLDGMQAGQCAASVVSHFNVLVHCEAEAFDLYVTRSFGLAFFEWLCRAGAPFGVQVRD